MLINKTHKSWCLVTIVALIVASVLYVVYARSMPYGPYGGSWQGMLFGIAGAMCMIYAGLLSGRKALPGAQLGTVQFWLKGHLWVGFLSVPLIFFHTGFRFGGPFEIVLMACFLLVIVSGIYGLILQQFLPRLLTTVAPAQAISEQIPVACQRLLDHVDRIVLPLCRADQPATPQPEPSVTNQAYTPERELYEFYTQTLRTFLRPDADRGHVMVNRTLALAQLSQLEGSMPPRLQPAIREMKTAYEERRQLMSQSHIHFWLHNWLLLHIPLSLALLVLSLVHVAISMYY